jgi:ABC-type Zn2+ transport system substrate-binding protein/surface adhesin
MATAAGARRCRRRDGYADAHQHSNSDSEQHANQNTHDHADQHANTHRDPDAHPDAAVHVWLQLLFGRLHL